MRELWQHAAGQAGVTSHRADVLYQCLKRAFVAHFNLDVVPPMLLWKVRMICSALQAGTPRVLGQDTVQDCLLKQPTLVCNAQTSGCRDVK